MLKSKRMSIPTGKLREFLFESAIWAHGVLEPDVMEARRILRRGDQASAEELTAMRDHAFVRLVHHVYENVPYYRRVMDERGLQPGDVRSLSDLQLFPVLTKDIIQKEIDNLRATNIADKDTTLRRSGGTTGEPIPSYANRLARALETQSFFRGLRWMGWLPSMRRVILSGGSLGTERPTSARERIRNFVSCAVNLPAFEVGPENIHEYVRVIQRGRSCILIGYASVLYNLADLLDEVGRPSLPVQYVFSTAEMMPPDWEARISEVLGAPVKSYYGCGEINSAGYQLEPGGSYCIPDEHIEVESITDEEARENVLPRKSLLFTALYNYAQPFIRYANGDAGEIDPPGASHPTRHSIRRLLGRTGDMFVRRDGSRVSSSFGPHIVYVTKLPVKRYQFVQHDRNRIQFVYEPLRDRLTSEEEATVTRILQDHLGETMTVNFEKSSNFLVSPSGKHRIVVSKI